MWAPPPLPRTLEASLRDLVSKRAETRSSAIRDLARHALAGDDARTVAVRHFERTLEDESPIVRAAACVALADVKASEAVVALLIRVEDSNQHVRQMALTALGEIGDPRAIPRLARALTDERPEVRYQALIAYTRLQHESPSELFDAITQSLADTDAAIRHIALRLAEDLVEAGDLHLQTNPSFVERVAELLNDSVDAVRAMAAVFLAQQNDQRGSDTILAVVRGDLRGLDKEDEQEAIELAGRLRLKRAVPHLERRAWGPMRLIRDTSAWHSKIALARMGHSRAAAEILRDLGSIRRHVREAAVVAAGKAQLSGAKSQLRALNGAVDPDLLRDALERIS